MSEAKKPNHFNLLVARKYHVENEQGERIEKSAWANVGVAFPNKNGKGFTLQIVEGVALFGKVIMQQYEPKNSNEEELPE